MTDLSRWIYSPDIATWLSGGPRLEFAQQINCILSAPHRTLEDKLEGLRRLRQEAGPLKLLDDKIEAGETLEEIIYHGGGLRNVYETDIFCYGRKEEFLKRRIFTAPGAGIAFIKEQIEKAANRYEIEKDLFFGVLRKFYRRGARYMELEWNIILNWEGRIIYCLPETSEAIRKNDYWFGPMDYHYMRLPFASGTVVETVDSPFFPSVKGVIVNKAEPWEKEFEQNGEQWLLYPDGLYKNRCRGIGAVLLGDYTSITFGEEFVLPFIQFLRRYNGTFSESEKWIEELGKLVGEDKRCFGLILKDRQLGDKSRPYETCRNYVYELRERCGKL